MKNIEETFKSKYYDYRVPLLLKYSYETTDGLRIYKVSWIAKEKIRLAWQFEQALQNKQLAGVNVIVSGEAPVNHSDAFFGERKRETGLVKPLWRSVQHREHVTTVSAVSQTSCHYLWR